MKTKLTWLISLAVIGGVAWYVISTHLATVRQQQAAETKQQQKDASLAALALKYNAVTNWEASLPDRGVYSFSIDVSRALIQSNGQPVFIIMGLVDVEENSNSYTASFSEDVITTNGTFQLYVYLKCTQEQANYFFEKTGDYSSRTYAVVARLYKVERPRIRMRGSGEGDDSKIDIVASTDIFFANGKLLDAISLP
jgi:hypothetical protein